MGLHYGQLPWGELDLTRVFHPRTMLWEQAGPVCRIRLDVRAGRTPDAAGARAGQDPNHGALSVIHDDGVVVAAANGECVVPWLGDDVAVAEVLAEEVGVGTVGRAGAKADRTLGTRCRIEVRVTGPILELPVTDRTFRDAEPSGGLGVGDSGAAHRDSAQLDVGVVHDAEMAGAIIFCAAERTPVYLK